MARSPASNTTLIKIWQAYTKLHVYDKLSTALHRYHADSAGSRDRGRGRKNRKSSTMVAPHRGRRIRIGYVSASFRESHPVGQVLRTAFGFHDSQRFELYAYTLLKSDGSDARRQIEACAI